MTDEAKKERAEYMKEYRKKNREQINLYQRMWRNRNPDKVKNYNQSYWERKAIRLCATSIV